MHIIIVIIRSNIPIIITPSKVIKKRSYYLIHPFLTSMYTTL
uniref:Uncharacterized protein n=1 Tax=Bartonella rochalimae ATCC BAA-1498 TaxID=685782 RepID=E6YL76_9HYPH|nr:hypothetical protein BARRO_30195 [Bartonella rochalimae ATCC BAA-1498]